MRHLPITRDLKNSGTRYAPKFLVRFFLMDYAGKEAENRTSEKADYLLTTLHHQFERKILL